MDDLFFYFLAGMFGEELMRNLATKPYGFWVLCMVVVAIINVLVIVLMIVAIIVSILKTGSYDTAILAPGEPFSVFDLCRYMLNMFFVMQPEVFLISLVMGLLFSMGYRSSYKARSAERK